MSVPIEPLLDHILIAEFRQIAGADGQSLFEELRDLYLQNGPSRLAQIGASIHDPAKLAFHAHALKSMSLNMGARGVVDLAQALEGLGRAGSVDGAPELLQKLQAVFDETRTQLLGVPGQ
jgi:HPt (histidine-containing phosphotransfer) domain-containing protein